MVQETRIIMGMPVTVQIIDATADQSALNSAFDYFVSIDERFSTFKETSEITQINKGLIKPEDYSSDMKTVFELSEKTKQETGGYFDIVNNKGAYDPSGLVKGWAIFHAAQILKKMGFEHFYVEAGGDIQVNGLNEDGQAWKVGIKNPFNLKATADSGVPPEAVKIVKTVHLHHNEGVATSGSYERGSHIYNPKNRQEELVSIVSLTVIGKDIYEADRFATAAFAMKEQGIEFIEKLPGFEGYMIDSKGIATMSSGFEKYVQ